MTIVMLIQLLLLLIGVGAGRAILRTVMSALAFELFRLARVGHRTRPAIQTVPTYVTLSLFHHLHAHYASRYVLRTQPHYRQLMTGTRRQRPWLLTRISGRVAPGLSHVSHVWNTAVCRVRGLSPHQQSRDTMLFASGRREAVREGGWVGGSRPLPDVFQLSHTPELRETELLGAPEALQQRPRTG
jgi:hypothetical protein